MQTVFPVLYKNAGSLRVGGKRLEIASASLQDAPVVAMQRMPSGNTAEFRAFDGKLWVRKDFRMGKDVDRSDMWSFLNADAPAGPQMKTVGRYSRLELNPLILSYAHYRNLQAVLKGDFEADETDDTPDAMKAPVAFNLELQARELLDLEGQVFARSPGPEIIVGINGPETRKRVTHDTCRDATHPSYKIGSFRAGQEDEMREACALAGIELHAGIEGSPAVPADHELPQIDTYPSAMEAAGWTAMVSIGKLGLPDTDMDVLRAYVALRNAMYSRVPDADRRVAGFLRDAWPHPVTALDFPSPEGIAPLLKDLVDAAGDMPGWNTDCAKFAIARASLHPNLTLTLASHDEDALATAIFPG